MDKTLSNGFVEHSRTWIALREKMSILLVLLAFFVFLSFATPYFLTVDNIVNVMLQISINAIAAFGATFVIVLGGIDLSVGSVMLMVGITTTGFMANNSMPLVASIICALLLAIGIGFATGVFVTKLRIPAFIVTLGISYVTKGIGLVYSNGEPIYVKSEAFNQIGNGHLGIIPYPVIYMVIVFVILFILLNYTQYGRHVYAVGGNEEAARFSGINVNRIKLIAYSMAALLSALGGVIISARLYSGQPTIGVNAELDAIAAVIMGGASLNGGVGTLSGTLIGALLIGLINNGLNLLGVSPYWQYIAKGAVILIAVYASALRNKKLEAGN